MDDFNFTVGYGFNDGILIANATVKINSRVYKDEIPFFYYGLFTIMRHITFSNQAICFYRSIKIYIHGTM